MSELPRPLQPWTRELGFLRPEIGDHLGPWLPRLGALLGRARGRRTPIRDGEPDGYAGLSRRGSYERLLVSEWALAEAVPEEFLRRAADKEQLFVEPRRSAPKGSRRTIVLFDAGPEQLGPPRLVHLAILLVLLRRAESAGGALAWGHLQHPNTTLWQGLDPLNVHHLFRARTHRLGDEVSPWDEALLADSDVWIVGGPSAQHRGARKVVVADPYRVGESQLEVTLQDEGLTQQPVKLALPSDPICALLLRNPLASVGTSSVLDGAGSSTVRFNQSGSALLVTTGRHLYAIKMSRRGWKRPKEFWVADDARLIAAGWFRQRPVWLTIDGRRRLVVHNLDAATDRFDGALPVSAPDGLALPDTGHPLGELIVLPPVWHPYARSGPHPEGRMAVVFDDCRGSLWVLDMASPAITLLEDGCSRPLGLDGGDILVLVGPQQRRRWVRYARQGSPESLGVPGMQDYVRIDNETATAGPLRWLPLANPHFGCKDQIVLPGPTITRWTTSHYYPRFDQVDDGPGNEDEERSLAGALFDQRFGDGLVMVESDRQTIRVWVDREVAWQHVTEDPVVWVGVSRYGWIVWWSANGEICCRHPSNPKVPRPWSLEHLP